MFNLPGIQETFPRPNKKICRKGLQRINWKKTKSENGLP